MRTLHDGRRGLLVAALMLSELEFGGAAAGVLFMRSLEPSCTAAGEDDTQPILKPQILELLGQQEPYTRQRRGGGAYSAARNGVANFCGAWSPLLLGVVELCAW